MEEDKELPAVLHIVGKPLLERLKNWLRDTRYNWTDQRQGPGGCETCGHGADTFEVVDMDALEREIDSFGESLRNERKK